MPAQPGPVLAPHLRDLPRDGRGFLVPAEAPWSDDGTPHQAAVNPVIKLVLAAYRACPVCGFTVAKGEAVWRLHDEYSRTATHEEIAGPGPVYELDVPGHLVCMLYSALVCPYWRTQRGRLGAGVARFGDGRRGSAPSIMGFADYSVIVDGVRPIVGSGGQEFTLIYDSYLREIEFSNPLAELANIYEQERARCGKRYVQKKRRHYAPTFGGNGRLGLEVRQIAGYIAARGPDEVIDSHRGIFRSGFM